MLLRSAFFSLLLVGSAPAGQALRSPENQVFQFMFQGSCSEWSDGSTTKATLYLWVPEQCEKLRGLVIMGPNVPEQMLVNHPALRSMCAEQDLGIVWSVPSFWNFAKEAKGQDLVAVGFLERLLEGVAEVSGYSEVATAPWIPVGESGHLLMVMGLVNERPEKCVAAICVKNPHGPQNFTVPMLWTLGTAQEWGQSKHDPRTIWNSEEKTYAGWMRQRVEKNWPLSVLIEPGTGHFYCTDAMAEYFALYMKAALRARLTPQGGLKPVDLASGFFADLPLPGHTNLELTPASQTTPETRNRPWFFDETTARAAQAFAEVNWQAETQMPALSGGVNCSVNPFGFNSVTELKVTTDAEFSVQPVLLDTIPEGFVGAGGELAKTPGDPVAEWICGQFAPVEGSRFRIALDRSWPSGASYLVVRKSGDARVRFSVQPVMVRLQQNKTGRAQKISFEPITDVKVGTKSINLQAVSDSGLPVQFFVRSGPAVIEGNRLVFTQIPPRSKMPLPVTVVAWQWGQPHEPATQIAPLVEQTFLLQP